MQEIPDDDNRVRAICHNCNTIHYENPKVVVGCIPERDGQILLCKRAIEPRYGYWTLPAGFMELDESVEEGAARETMEEACAEVEIGHLFASVDIVDAGQVHLFFTAKLVSDFAPGPESLDVAMYDKDKIPWDEIAFLSGKFALERYLEDDGANNGVHTHTFRRSRIPRT